MNKQKNELKQMSSQELKQYIETCRAQWFSLRLNSTTTHIKDYSQFKKLRRNIARASTDLRQRNQG
jgi:ribosomal protein L29